jgi:predicted transglutaminase-like cysteine proteinase
VKGTILHLLAKLVLCSALIAGPALASSQAKDLRASLPKPTTMALAISDAKAPWGWTDFCTRHEDECNLPDAPVTSIALTADNWKLITSTNVIVNTAIREATDQEVYGVPERWEYPTSGAGDCEDFALEKRKQLINAGLPRQSLLMTVVTDENGFGHAILTVRTTNGDFELDNRTDRILAWEATGYGFVKQQAQDNPNHWVRLGGPTAPLMTATAQK